MLRVEELRKKRGMSQAELARAIGVSQTSICKYECGDANPGLETLVKLAKALDCKLDELVTDAAS